jgi:hypothetical protein
VDEVPLLDDFPSETVKYFSFPIHHLSTIAHPKKKESLIW